MRKTLLFCTLGTLLLATSAAAKPKEIKLSSPDGRIAVDFSLGQTLGYSVSLDGKTLVSDPAIALRLQDGTVLGQNPRLAKQKTREADETVEAPFQRNPQMRNHYNELDLKMKGGYGVIFRAYDNGVAYRFYTQMKDSIVIAAEDLNPTFPADCKSWLAYSTNPKKPMAMAFQNYFTEAPLSQADAQQRAKRRVRACEQRDDHARDMDFLDQKQIDQDENDARGVRFDAFGRFRNDRFEPVGVVHPEIMVNDKIDRDQQRREL